jgi:hypothetical protein
MAVIYGIELHSHRFSAWAASRAASVNECRFKVKQGREILEGCGFNESFSNPDYLPDPPSVDEEHRKWRRKATELAAAKGLSFTDGVAAKLINCYLKARFVCAGYSDHRKVAALHPPIDKLLLEELGAQNFGGNQKTWRRFSRDGWSKLNSDDYEKIISLIRQNLNGQPMWAIEEHWVGYQ